MKHTFKVLDMMCGNCAWTIRKTLDNVEGVENIEFDVPNKFVIIHGTSDSYTLRNKIEGAGFTIEDEK
ncbi:MAG: heavy-metal-associated domain-containing protein [Candidatus Marinimicrobia bacterium]|nr:heavy-metal-associated domain-containing protein [Candidatus Neomarinimicrobiota bacterium]MBL7022443.1 heavy-metal-associated domain-containing protein [Candidatus Neomarinimicrobiota bacterium]MBL7108702.1 heavy-metal-associated domain-containing protein [Candidatus Neomarinimicrobiota bacterium]